jgi:hypothetical protein
LAAHAQGTSQGVVVLGKNQPILNQMIGNCYAYAGTEALSGNYLTKRNLEKVSAPHPFLLAGFVADKEGRGNVRSGSSCGLFNTAKTLNTNICSTEGFERFLAAQTIPETSSSLSKRMQNLDETLKSLDQLFKLGKWKNEDKLKAKDYAGQLIESMCALGSIVSLDKEFTHIVDQARNIIEMVHRDSISENAPKSFWETTLVTTSSLYLLQNAVSSYFKERDKNRMVNTLLEDIYKGINQRCLDFEKKAKIARVPAYFFLAPKDKNCSTTTLSKDKLYASSAQTAINVIDQQILAGQSTPITLCAGIFYAKSYSSMRTQHSPYCKEEDYHAITVVGREIRNGKRVFRIKNSWGAGVCSRFERSRNNCLNSKAQDCPSAEDISCQDDHYYISASYLARNLNAYGKIETEKGWFW